MIRKAASRDARPAARLAGKLWGGHTEEELWQEMTELAVDRKAAVFLAEENGKAVGFAQCQLRSDYVEGAKSKPVEYLEGIYVEPECRRKGVASELLRHCQQWAKAQGCAEFASDCEWSNSVSRQFHVGTGFREANRIICFLKKL